MISTKKWKLTSWKLIVTSRVAGEERDQATTNTARVSEYECVFC